MISICTALYKRGQHYSEMRATAPPVEMVVCDHGSDDVDLSGVVVTTRPLPFRRAAALNQAARLASGKILAFIDADMLLPSKFTRLIYTYLDSGRAWFPVCWSRHRDGTGWWRDTGYGNCVFHADDFWRLGGWDECYTTWGREDEDLYRRAIRAGMDVIRARMPGLIHQWHPNDYAWKNQHY